MEPAPRLYHYDGLFTSVRSIDLPLKIIFTSSIFITLILVAAWYFSRKVSPIEHHSLHYTLSQSYRRAPRALKFNVANLNHLLHLDICDKLLDDENHSTHKTLQSAMTGRLCKLPVMIINDWKLIDLYKQDIHLDCFYSAAPSSLRRQWYGLLVSDNTLPNRSHLRSLWLHAFDTLSNSAYLSVGMKGGTIPLAKPGSRDVVVHNQLTLDSWLWKLLMEFVFFTSFPHVELDSNVMGKSAFMDQMHSHIRSLECWHLHGHIPRDEASGGMPSSVKQLLHSLTSLITPLIRFETERFLMNAPNAEADQSATSSSDSASLLYQLIRAHRELDETGEYVTFVKASHLIHCVTELCLILRHILMRHLNVLFTVLAHRPCWQLRLRNEVTGSLDSTTQTLNPASLSLDADTQLVWTKALVFEAIRFTAPGWPLDCVRQAARDGELFDFDYAEGELILFNQKAYLSDPQLWGSKKSKGTDDIEDATLPHNLLFDPKRFLHPTKQSKQCGGERLHLPIHWARFLLMGYTVCVPNDAMFRLLVSILSNLVLSGWQFRDANTEADLNLTETPLCVNSDLSYVIVQPHEL